ncbi:MAG: hypothetical protein AAB390_02125 [Patescibacteria group bacterium]
MERIRVSIVGWLALCAMLAIAPVMMTGCSNNDELEEMVVASNAAIPNSELYETLAHDAPRLDSTGDENVVQLDGVLIVDGVTCGPIEEWMATSDMGCTPMPQQDNEGYYATMAGALELDGSFDLSMPCGGNCGPAGVHWCCGQGDCTQNGDPYLGRDVCVPILSEDGVCHMRAVAFPCAGGEYCELVGSYPTWAQCLSCKSAADCNDDNSCTTDSCNAATGECAHANNTLACNDGNACTNGDTCIGGVCVSGISPDCSDANACTIDTCVPATGCAHAAVANITDCNDGNACTLGDKCTAGVCGGTAKSCNDSNPCTADTCVPATGLCDNQAASNGTSCGAGMMCVSGGCYSTNDTCTDKGKGQCRQPGGMLGHYTCLVAMGASLGTWELTELCGAVIEKITCADDTGCTGVGPTEGACVDTVDNDGDGWTDCFDPDCASSQFCSGGVVCSADADCDSLETLTCSGGVLTTPAYGCVQGKCTGIGGGTQDCVNGCAASGQACAAPCVPQCTGKVCGDNGCGGVCGTCAAGTACNAAGACVAPCVPQCTGKVCGSDGCGSTCGTCAAGQACNNGTCDAPTGSGIGFVAKAADTDVHCWDINGAHIGKFAVVSGDSFSCPAGAGGAIAAAVTTTVAACQSCLNNGGAYGPCHDLSGGGFGCQL